MGHMWAILGTVCSCVAKDWGWQGRGGDQESLVLSLGEVMGVGRGGALRDQVTF